MTGQVSVQFAPHPWTLARVPAPAEHMRTHGPPPHVTLIPPHAFSAVHFIVHEPVVGQLTCALRQESVSEHSTSHGCPSVHEIVDALHEENPEHSTLQARPCTQVTPMVQDSLPLHAMSQVPSSQPLEHGGAHVRGGVEPEVPPVPLSERPPVAEIEVPASGEPLVEEPASVGELPSVGEFPLV